MYSLINSNSFKKDYKRIVKRNYNISLLKETLEVLTESGTLPTIYKPHKLIGDYSGRWECHIKPDWLLIWKQDDEKKEIYLERTGTHSDLF